MAFCRADVSDNIRRSEGLLKVAGSCGSQLIVFPELCMTGYSFLSADEAIRVAEPAGEGQTSKFMRRASVELNSYVAWGFIELLDGCLFNSASISGPDGSMLVTYRKINLWGNDFLWATPGISPPEVVMTELGLMSVVVCRDVRDKIPGNIPRTASKDPPLFDGKRVDIVAMCVNWGKGGFPSTSWMEFVADNKCTAVIANRWGEERNGTFCQDFGQGGSAIIESDWKVHTGGLKFGEDCVVSTAI